MADQKQGGAATLLKESIAGSPATDRLKEEAAAFAAAQAQRLLIAGGRKLGAATTRLQDMAEGNGPGIDLGRLIRGGGSDDKRAGTGTGRFVTIVEDTDVGVPLGTAHDQWTRFEESSSFAKVLADGRSKGIVTFHELTPDLTRVLMVIEYHPKGIVQWTANLWRSQGRRARLDLQHFRRFVMLRGEEDEPHEDAVAREEDEETVDTYEDEGDAEAYEGDEEEAYEGEGEYEDEPEAEYEYEDEDEEEGEPADEFEPEPERVR
ncbi:hypothetical protein [Streptomyces violens]|uniref:hypothetical protein n=1 Tax=Streptomyces violens TaxID=66377 RepID=UPI0004C07F17|nr:hypothetical protein [Streptomyces violens]